MSEEDFNFTDLGFGDRFVFVPRPDRMPVTASGVLNNVTAFEPNLNDFFNQMQRLDIDGAFRFLPPSIQSTGNGDDIEVMLTTDGLELTVTIRTNADGSNTTVSFDRLAMTPEDFAALLEPVDPNIPGDFDLVSTLLGLTGFEFVDPFGGGDLTQGLDGLNFDGLTISDGGLFGGLFGFGGGDFGGGFSSGFDLGFNFSFGSGGGGFSNYDGGGGYHYTETDFSSLSLG